MRNLRVLALLLSARSFFRSCGEVGSRVVSERLLFSFFVVPAGGAADATVVGRVSPPRRGGLVAGCRRAFGEHVVFAEPALRVASPLPFLEILGLALGRGMCPVLSGNRLLHFNLPARRGWRPPVFGVARLRFALPGHGGAAFRVSSEGGPGIRHSPFAVVAAFRSFRVAVLCLFASFVGAGVALGCLWFVVLAGVGAFLSWARGLDKGAPRKGDRITKGFCVRWGRAWGWGAALPLGWPCGTGRWWPGRRGGGAWACCRGEVLGEEESPSPRGARGAEGGRCRAAPRRDARARTQGHQAAEPHLIWSRQIQGREEAVAESNGQRRRGRRVRRGRR